MVDRLQNLSEDKLSVVYGFISYLLERDTSKLMRERISSAQACMLASEDVLGRDWERPEEDAAWANL